MKEVKSPRKPLLYYYSIVVLVLLLFNIFVSPLLLKQAGHRGGLWYLYEHDRRKKISARSRWRIPRLFFTDKENETVYKTGVMDDPGLTERLYESGAKFAKDIEKTMSPLLSIFLTVVLPMLNFYRSWTVYEQKADGADRRKKMPWRLAWERAT